MPVGGGAPLPLLRERLLVGRRSRGDIHRDFPKVSSQHCELEMDSGYWQLRDLRRTNGVKVNGQRVEVQVLMPGDKLTVGRHEFEVVYQPLTDGPPPTLAEEDPFSRSLLEQAGLEARRKSQRRSERLTKQLPPAVRTPGKTDASGEDTEILGWLTDDDVAE